MNNDAKHVIIKWKRYNSYDEASSDTSKGIYIHDWQGKPYYVGMLSGSTFGTRYISAYRHWIDGCIEHGARLFIGSVVQTDVEYIESIETIVIQLLNPLKNRIRKLPQAKLHLIHEGQVPEYLQ